MLYPQPERVIGRLVTTGEAKAYGVVVLADQVADNFVFCLPERRIGFLTIYEGAHYQPGRDVPPYFPPDGEERGRRW